MDFFMTGKGLVRLWIGWGNCPGNDRIRRGGW